MERSNAKRLIEFLQSQREAMVRLLELLARNESPTGNAPAQDAVLGMLGSELDDVDFRTRRFGRRCGQVLYGRPRRRTRPAAFQLLLGHCDTVWPVGTLQDMPVTSSAGTVRGPGVFDMKGGLVQMIFALRALHELELEPPLVPVVLVNSDEEVGSPKSTPLIGRLARAAARAFVLEPAFGRSGKLKTSRKAIGSFTIVVKGKAAHAGISPGEGTSAILEISHQIQKLFALNDPARGITLNVGMIDGGLRPNVVAPEAKAIVDVRVPSRQDAETIERALRSLEPVVPGTQIEVQGHFGRPAMEADARNQALWHLAHQLGHELGLDLAQAAVGGGSDGNTTSQYTATLDGLGPVGDGAHAVHEMTEIAPLVERSALLALLLLAPPASAAQSSHDQAEPC